MTYKVQCNNCKKELNFKSVHWFQLKPYCFICRKQKIFYEKKLTGWKETK